jgi:hypothetical protein
VIDGSVKNPNRITKILLYSFEDPDGSWEAEGDDWYRWALPVYRMPQGSWSETTEFTRQKIWFTASLFGDAASDPNTIQFTPWLQCYWDSQAGRWVVLAIAGGGIIIMTPTAGIPARSGALLGHASCELYSINNANELIPTGNSLEILNMTNTPVEGNAYGQAKRVSGRWVIDVEECDPDEPSISSSTVVP